MFEDLPGILQPQTTLTAAGSPLRVWREWRDAGPQALSLLAAQAVATIVLCVLLGARLMSWPWPVWAVALAVIGLFVYYAIEALGLAQAGQRNRAKDPLFDVFASSPASRRLVWIAFGYGLAWSCVSAMLFVLGGTDC